MNRKETIAISKPTTGQEEWEALKEPIFSGWLTSGPKVNEFEELFGERHKVDHAIAVTSATTALHLALVALEIQEGDEVIVPAFTWVSTANVVVYQKAKVVFCDIDTDTFNLDIDRLKTKITPRTKAIIAVHLFGLCADIDRIKEVAGDIPIIEDAACASGSSLRGKPAGGLGAIGCFSFHPRKSVTTGEGGMVTTNDDRLADKIRKLRNHGASISEEQRHHGPQPYILPEFNMLGYNYRMTDLQGAVGVVQIKKLDQLIREREKWAAYYIEHLEGLPWLKLPRYSEAFGHGWQSFVTMIDEDQSPYPRNQLMQQLLEAGISTRPGTHAVHMLSYYSEKYGIEPQDFPRAQQANDRSMAIPLHNHMSKNDYDHVVQVLREF